MTTRLKGVMSSETKAKLTELFLLLEEMPELIANKFLGDFLALFEHGRLDFTVVKRLPAAGTVNGAIGLDIVGVDELIAAARSTVKLDGIAHRKPLSC